MINSLQKVWDSPFDLLRDMDRVLQGRVGIDEDDLIAKYPVDIHEDENGLTVLAELPGFTREQVDVDIENGVLTIAAKRASSKPESGTARLYERRFNRVRRQFTLPTTVDTGDVQATLSDGLLTLRLKKKEEVKPRKIQVN